jgi:hypothetical protein
VDVSKVRFLLIQGEVLDAWHNPDNLGYQVLDDTKPFKVAIGCVNEFGEQEIIGIVAVATPTPDCKRWIVSSHMDGYDRMVGCTDRMADYVKSRLRSYYRSSMFSDLCQLPQPITIRGEE